MLKYAWVMEYACDRTQYDFPVSKCRIVCELSEFIIIYELVYNMGLDILLLIIISFTRDKYCISSLGFHRVIVGPNYR